MEGAEGYYIAEMKQLRMERNQLAKDIMELMGEGTIPDRDRIKQYIIWAEEE